GPRRPPRSLPRSTTQTAQAESTTEGKRSNRKEAQTQPFAEKLGSATDFFGRPNSIKLDPGKAVKQSVVELTLRGQISRQRC
ncbi:MAG: hypothetical protein ACUVQR_11515, partial [Thermogutta sp.]